VERVAVIPTIVALIQARLSSHRLPGKVLKPLRGRPMIGYLIEALTHCSAIDGVVLATSDTDEDDAVAAFAEREGICCHRGPLDNVLDRVRGAGRAAGASAIVRLSGDSPLLDPALVDRAVRLFRLEQPDLVSNVVVRSFPKGQSVEVIALEALDRAAASVESPHDREHVTTFIYRHPERFAIRGFSAERPRPDLQLSVDEPADFARCEAILDRLGMTPWQAGWEACAEAHEALSGLGRA
jgi:spore coat polysaccharide biosynthesis protein SpsF